MSLLVEIRKQPRIVNGELKSPGETCRLPNALAMALENKGLVGWPGEKASMLAAEAKAKKKSAKAKSKP